MKHKNKRDRKPGQRARDPSDSRDALRAWRWGCRWAWRWHAALGLSLAASLVQAQALDPAPASDPDPLPTLAVVEVIGVTPLPGLGVPRDQVAAPVQSATDADLERLQATDLTDLMARSLGSVSVNQWQGNPFQPEINFRGFTASPLLGTPQGLSVYLDGMRLNQPFGDVLSWDLVPRPAIATVLLMPGSNPLFGLNTLGGAIAITTKDGLRNPGGFVQSSVGSYGRASVEFESGGSRPDGLHWFVAGQRLHERGWRTASPSDLEQLFAKVGKLDAQAEVTLTAAIADNRLTGNGLQEQAALARDWRGVYTLPDQTQNRAGLLSLSGSRFFDERSTLSGQLYVRRTLTRTLNGDVNEGALDQSLYQPRAAERGLLADAGYQGFPLAGESAANTPFPLWRCIANVLGNTEPNEKCSGLVNRSDTRQTQAGLGVQYSGEREWAGRLHRFVVGAAYDQSRVRFGQGTQFGFIAPDRSVVGVNGPGAFADGTQDSENAFDARVALQSRSRTHSVFASDTMALDERTHLTLSGRYNRVSVHTVDGITPGGGTGSLDGDHRFSHFNPAVGLTFAPSPDWTVYAGINQGSRAPTAVELGCADPASPCRLPNAFAGDPPLKQVVTTTIELGLRGRLAARTAWNLGVFRSTNRDDLLFVADSASAAGYFRNFGQTRRQGIEAGIETQAARGWTLGANLLLLDATFRSPEQVGGSGNSSNDAALAGFPGTDGRIAIRPGDRIPLLPRQLLKLRADWTANAQWRFGADLLASSGANARGNENGLHQPDGVFFTGPGRSAGYAVLNLDAQWRPTPRLKVFLRVDNVFDRRYATGAQLGANAFAANGALAARTLPANANGDFPVPRATFLAPGAPRGAWIGLRYALDG